MCTMLKPDSSADALLSTTIAIAATTGATTESVATAVGTESVIATETGIRPRVEAKGSGIGGGAARGPGLATGAATEAETGVLGGARLAIGIGLRGGTDAIGLFQDQGNEKFASLMNRCSEKSQVRQCLCSRFVDKQRPKISCTKTQTLPNLRLLTTSACE